MQSHSCKNVITTAVLKLCCLYQCPFIAKCRLKPVIFFKKCNLSVAQKITHMHTVYASLFKTFALLVGVRHGPCKKFTGWVAGSGVTTPTACLKVCFFTCCCIVMTGFVAKWNGMLQNMTWFMGS